MNDQHDAVVHRIGRGVLRALLILVIVAVIAVGFGVAQQFESPFSHLLEINKLVDSTTSEIRVNSGRQPSTESSSGPRVLDSEAERRAMRAASQLRQAKDEREGEKQIVEVVTRYVDEITMQDVRDPETGVVSRVPVRVKRPVTETIRRDTGGGVPSYYPAATSPLSPPATSVSEAESRAMRIAAQLRQAKDEPEREKLRRQLTDTLGGAFDERRQQQRQAIDRLEQQLQSLRALDTQRGQRKDEIVQRRLEELLGQPDLLAWDIGPSQGGIPSASQPERPHLRSGINGPFMPADPPRLLPPQSGLLPPQAAPRPMTILRDANSRGSESAGRSSFGQPSPSRLIDGSAPGQKGGPNTSLLPPTEKPKTSASVPPRAASPAEGPVGFDAAERIIDLLLEIKQIRAELEPLRARVLPPDIVDPTRQQSERFAERFAELIRQLESKERVTQAKLDVAEIGWRTLQQQLTNEAQLARQQAAAADQRLKAMQRSHEYGATPSFEVQVHGDAALKADLELQTAEARLDGWRQTEAILQKQREALGENGSSSPSADAEEPTPDAALESEADGEDTSRDATSA